MKLTELLKSSARGIAKGLAVSHALTTFYYHVDSWWPSHLSEKLEDHIERFFIFTTAFTVIGSYAAASFHYEKPYLIAPVTTQPSDFIIERSAEKEKDFKTSFV